MGLLMECKRQTAKEGRVWSCSAVGRQHKAPSMWLLLSWFECLELRRFQRSKYVWGQTLLVSIRMGPTGSCILMLGPQLVELLGKD